MPSLLHLPLDPFSRKIRIVLGEKKITASLAVEPIWERRHEFLSINPAGTVPVFIEDDGTTISTSQAIAEYLEETSKEPAFIFGTALQRAEIRRLCNWFDVKFNTEVTEYLLGEKIMKRFLGLGEPSSETIRAGYANIDTHLGYIEYLAEQRAWLAGENFSLADITAASHISCIDYLGDIAWEDYQQAKQRYARIKSRPSFRPHLQDLIPGTQPPAHYKNLDF